ncbi:MAG: hypothetical protein HQ446_14570 [Polaromonas sp.]|nr:hypothetical protein [Polaromonas sp.]
MKHRVVFVVMATALGAAIGAGLGYGPLLKYKTEGVLAMEMGTAEYKRFSELANDTTTVRQYMIVSPPPDVKGAGIDGLVGTVARGQWHKAVPKVSRADAKELPDVLLQLEQEREKVDYPRTLRDDPRAQPRERKPATVYLGLRLTHTASEPQQVANIATWLGEYFKDVATREAVREQVSRWKADNRQFSDRALERKLKFEFDIQQAQTRVTSLKTIVAAYPDAARRDSQQVVDVRRDNEKFMSPMSQLVGAESEIIDIRERLQKLEREIEQQAFVKSLVLDADNAANKAQSGSDSVRQLSVVITEASKRIKTEAEREKLSSLAADLSQIAARFLSQAQFVAKPSVPSVPERPTPLMVTVLGALLAAFLAALFMWRKLIIDLLWRDDRENLPRG